MTCCLPCVPNALNTHGPLVSLQSIALACNLCHIHFSGIPLSEGHVPQDCFLRIIARTDPYSSFGKLFLRCFVIQAFAIIVLAYGFFSGFDHCDIRAMRSALMCHPASRPEPKSATKANEDSPKHNDGRRLCYNSGAMWIAGSSSCRSLEAKLYLGG